MAYYKDDKYESFDATVGCVLCRVGYIPSSGGGKRPLFSHHSGMNKDKYGNKIGRMVNLCRNHHGFVHGVYNREAIKLAKSADPKFFDKLFIKILKKEIE